MIWPNEECIVKQYFYYRKETKLSDHRSDCLNFMVILVFLLKRPVCAYYNLEIKKINTEKKEEILNLISNYIVN